MQAAREAVRTQLLTLSAGVFAAGALTFTARNFTLSRRTVELTRQTFELTEQGQVTDRYTKAIEQLGSAKLDVRIGGIYALERVARDSTRDHPTVMEVLAAFIREHSREPWPLNPSGSMTEHFPRPDVQAALTVIGRRNVSCDGRPIDLTGACLPGALLIGGDLTGVRFVDADLRGAVVAGAKLIGAKLAGASLTGATMTGTILTDADLAGANLNAANLRQANLTKANLNSASFAGADLTGAGVCQGSWTVPRVAGHAAVAADRYSVSASWGVR